MGTISASIKHLWSKCKGCNKQGHLGHFITMDEVREPIWEYVEYCACCKYKQKEGTLLNSKSNSLDSQVLDKFGQYMFEHNAGVFLFVNEKSQYLWYKPCSMENCMKFYHRLYVRRHQFIQNEEFYKFKQKTKYSKNAVVGKIKTLHSTKISLLEDCKKLKYDLKLIEKDMKKKYTIKYRKKKVTFEEYGNGIVRDETSLAAPAGVNYFPKLMDESSCDYMYQTQQLLVHKVTHDLDFCNQFKLAFHNMFDKNGKLNLGVVNKLNYKIFVEYMYWVKDVSTANDCCSDWQTSTMRSPLNSDSIKHYGLKLLKDIVYGYATSMAKLVKPQQKVRFNGYQLMIYNHFNTHSLGLRYHKDNFGILNYLALVPALHYHGQGAVSFSTTLENQIKFMKDEEIINLLDNNNIFYETGLFKNKGDGYTMTDEVLKFYEHGVVNPSKIGSLANYQSALATKKSKLFKLKKLPNGLLAVEDDGLLVPQSCSAVVRTYFLGLPQPGTTVRIY